MRIIINQTFKHRQFSLQQIHPNRELQHKINERKKMKMKKNLVLDNSIIQHKNSINQHHEMEWQWQ